MNSACQARGAVPSKHLLLPLWLTEPPAFGERGFVIIAFYTDEETGSERGSELPEVPQQVCGRAMM